MITSPRNDAKPERAECRSRKILAVPCLLMLLLAFRTRPLTADEIPKVAGNPQSVSKTENVSVDMRAAGVGRYVANRWGVVKGRIANPNDQPVSSMVVVTPTSSNGVQFARQVQVPARTSFEAVWPVHITSVSPSGGVDFRYLFFPNGEDDGVIRHAKDDKEIPSFSGVSQQNPLPLCGLISDADKPTERASVAHQILAVMRYASLRNTSVVQVNPAEITPGNECLDAMDQLAIADSQLTRFPQACEAIRLWVQGGGRLMIMMDRSGPEVLESLLGDSLPLTLVGETTTNKVTLEINADYPAIQYPARSVIRQFDEPIRYLRVVPGSGETIWTIDGWPVALRTGVGKGVVTVTTVSSDVFIEHSQVRSDGVPSHTMIASSRRMLESFSALREAPILTSATAADAAAALIGYEIPSKNLAMILLAIFPISLLVAGLFLQRRALGERLVVVVPALAILAALPAAAVGFRARSVAPATIIETSLIQSSPGFTELPADGFATVFVPAPRQLQASSRTSAKLDVVADATNADYRRLIWKGLQDVAWINLEQPAGLRTYPMKATRKLQSPWRALTTFDENGIRGTLPSGEDLNPVDAMLAGVNHENLALNLGDNGEFSAGVADSLVPGQFFRSALVQDEQKFRAALMRSVFFNPSSTTAESFPTTASLVYWSTVNNSALDFADTEIRRQRSILVVQPLELLPPEAGKPITIPSPLLQYRSVATIEGGVGSVFSNMNRQWLTQEVAATTLLEYQLPKVCLPFAVSSANLEIVIRAGSRIVTLDSGEREHLQQIAELRSPLGSQTISIPPEVVQQTCLSGKLYLQIRVNDLDAEMKAGDLSGEQDDTWQIERVLLTLKGHRQP